VLYILTMSQSLWFEDRYTILHYQKAVEEKFGNCLVSTQKRKGQGYEKSPNEKIVNALPRNWRLGGVVPWNLYLCWGNPAHYTNPALLCIIWKGYVAGSFERLEHEGDVQSDKVILLKMWMVNIGLSTVVTTIQTYASE